MRQRYTIELMFVVFVLALSLTGFSSLARGDSGPITGYHVLHVTTSIAWLLLLGWQLLALRTRRADRHRAVGAVGELPAAALALAGSAALIFAAWRRPPASQSMRGTE